MTSMTQTLISWLTTVGYVGGGIFFVLATILYFHQEKLLYHPAPPGYRSPAEHRIPFEDHMIEAADGVKIHAWLLKQPEAMEKHATVIFFHGNAGNIGFRLPNCAELHRRAKVNILMVDYRGFGNSEGSPTEEGLRRDAEAALRFLRKRPDIDPKKIFLLGRSLGGAVSLSLVERHPDEVAGVILENTFLDISSMVDEILPQLRYLKHFVLRMKWSSIDRIRNVKVPILFISGLKDELVPPRHMRLLYDEASLSDGKMWFEVSTGTHNDTWLRGGSAYYQKVMDFISRVLDRHKEAAEPLGGDKADENQSCKATGVAGNSDEVHQPGYIPSMLDDPLFQATARSKDD